MLNIGIDLGTTFSAAAWVNEDNQPTVIINSDGSRLTPSSVMEEHDGSIIVGEVAKENAVIMADSVVNAAKNHMGTTHSFLMPSGKKFTPEEISGFILKKIKQDAERELGKAVTGAVITVPAYFTDAQRKATEDAGRIAGLNIIGMINEPTAAAIYYAHKNKLSSANILVYDLGGGTFDVSIVQISPERVEVKATGGIRKLGGHFFDQMILNFVTEYLLDEHGIDLFDDEYSDELQELSLKAEECKIRLSTKEAEQIVIKVGSVKERLTITRQQFEGMLHKFYLRTESTIDMVMDDAGMTWKDINKILLVGGSSRIPMIVEKLRAASGIEPSQDINPEEAVALGAAIYANPSHAMKEIVDVNSHSLGIVTIDAATKSRKNTIVIPRDTMLPANATREFYTYAADTPQIVVEIAEGEDDDIEFVNILTELAIELPPKTSRNTAVAIEMQLDKNQILHVFARIATTPEIYREIHIERKYNLGEEDIALKTALVSELAVQ